MIRMTFSTIFTGTSLLCLTACGDEHPKSAGEIPIIKTVEVVAPIATGCVPANIAGPPDYPDTDAALRAAPGPAERYQLLYAGRKVRTARLNELEPVVTGPNACPKATPK